MKKLIVIGGGPGGNMAALTAARHGAESVVLVEKDSLGGTCTNRGCIPTKFLLSRLAKKVMQEGGAGGEWRKIVAHKNALVRGLASSIEKNCREARIDIVRGHGRLAGEHTVEVEGEGGDVLRLEGENIVIATGSSPLDIPAFAIDGEKVLTSTEALNMDAPPRSMVIIGSGAVGSEFAFIYQRAGTKVTIVEGVGRLFPGEDREVHDLFTKVYGKMGIEFVTDDPVEAVETGREGGVRVVLRSGELLEADNVLAGVGRRLLTADIGLETVGIERGDGGEIAVDEKLRTSCPNIFAVGDVTGKLLLAHLATHQGIQAAMGVVGRPSRHIPYHAVPWAIFTTPEIATVGINETEANRRDLDSVTACVPWMDNVKARIDRTTEGFVKIVAERKGGRVVGGTVVGIHASDLIHVISAAVHEGATVSDMAGMVFVHPGMAETIHDVLQILRHRLHEGPADRLL